MTQRALNLGRERDGPEKVLRVHVVLTRLVDNAQMVRGAVRRRAECPIYLPDFEGGGVTTRADADDEAARRHPATGGTA